MATLPNPALSDMDDLWTVREYLRTTWSPDREFVDGRIEERNASRFCAGCHDVALLIDGAMSGDVAPADPRGHGGITCRVCHGIESVHPDGNGSYELAATQCRSRATETTRACARTRPAWRWRRCELRRCAGDDQLRP